MRIRDSGDAPLLSPAGRGHGGGPAARFVVFDESTRIVAESQVEHEQIYPRPDWVEHDPVEIKETTALGAAFAAGLAVGVFGGLEDPDSGSIVGRRASGFLQVSLLKVSRHSHRGTRPASSAETPPMNAND